MKKTQLIFTVIAASIVLSACGNSSQGETTVSESSTTAETTVTETTLQETTVPETESVSTTMGETASLGNWNITVSNMQILDSIDNGYGAFVPDEGNKYLLITAKVENSGKEADTFLPSFGLNDDVSAKVLYGDGYEFSITQLLGYSEDLINSTINPLSYKEGNMAFEIPNSVAESTDPLIVEFNAGNDAVSFTLR